MPNKLKIGNKAKITVSWDVLPVDFSTEKEQKIKDLFSKKYGISPKMISVEPNFIMLNNEGENVALTNDTIKNIQDPKFQHELFKDWIKENNIEDCDFDKILEIDSQINSLIDYDVYDKFKRYQIKWIKWSNFLSYGENNYFDFTSLSGLVLLNGEPANQSGKSTFAYDLLHFLLFGKTSSGKADVLSDIFNRYKPEATEVNVEGCVCIDDEDYIIRRTLTRPSLKRRSEKSKVTQKVQYYKMVNGEEEELADSENLEGNGNVQTSKIIKQAIGNEKDFDLVICANSDNLKSLISLKDTERGRLLSKWIGLLPLEEKDSLARDKWNKEIMPSLISNTYNISTLNTEISELEKEIKENDEKIKSNNRNIAESNKKLEGYKTTHDTLLSSKKDIDDNLTSIDITTVQNEINDIVSKGKEAKAKKAEKEKELESLKNVAFSEDEYSTTVSQKENLITEIATIKNDIYNLRKQNDNLRKSEYCPTCGRKLEGVDYSNTIAENKTKENKLIEIGKSKNESLNKKKEKINELETNRKLFYEKNKLEILVQKLGLDAENLLSKWKEKTRLIKDFNANKEAIENNNKIMASLNVVNESIKIEENIKSEAEKEIASTERLTEMWSKDIENRKTIIKRIEEEEKLVRNWKIYLALVGKNGISKMVLRKTLPLINGELKRLLNGVTDFDVEVIIDERNDVAFNIIRDGVEQNLSSGSGFEQTAAALALRVVLGNISTLSRPSFILFDEVLGGVAKENYENIKLLYDRIVKDYSFIFQITHLTDIIDWHSSIVTVKKESNISSIGQVKN